MLRIDLPIRHVIAANYRIAFWTCESDGVPTARPVHASATPPPDTASSECWNKFRYYMRREYGTAPTYIAVIEYQKVTGLAHIHAVIDRWIDQQWIKKSWQSIGGGEHVDIRYKDVHRAAAYMSKYLAKDMLLNVPPGVRRITTSRSIELNEKQPPMFDWIVLKTPLVRLYVLHIHVAQETRNGPDGEIESFSVLE